MALNAEIAGTVSFDRKHYFYPDLPKGYQITQHRNPIIRGGKLAFILNDTLREVSIHHVHLEEDAGKSFHDTDNEFSYIDYNRAGVALLELVTEPCLHSAEEVEATIGAIRQLVQYLGIGSGDMEKGALRCDCNVSIRRPGEAVLNAKCEIKNLNSKRFARKAVEAEFARQVALADSGESIREMTLHYDPVSDKTSPMREKDSYQDYRYMPEPDIPAFPIEGSAIEEVKEKALALRPMVIYQQLLNSFSISRDEAWRLTEEKAHCEYLLDLINMHAIPSSEALDLFLQKIAPWLKASGQPPDQFPITAQSLSDFVRLILDGQIPKSLAYSRLFPLLLSNPEVKAVQLAKKHDLLSDSVNIVDESLIVEVLNAYPEKVKEYLGGRNSLIGFFMGEILRKSSARPDPVALRQLLFKKLSEIK